MSAFSSRNNGLFSITIENCPGILRGEISALKDSLRDPEVDIKTWHNRGILYFEITPREGERRSESRGLISSPGESV